MLRKSLWAISLLLLTTTMIAKGFQERTAIDWILILDTSQSMRGIGGTANILDEVKSVLIRHFVEDGTRVNDSVTLLTFDRSTQIVGKYIIANESDKVELSRLIRHLKADGIRTHIGAAILDGARRARELHESSGGAERTQCIVLFTDGREDVRGIPNPIPILSTIRELKLYQPYVFFVSLGLEHESQVDSLVKELGKNGKVFRDQGAINIDTIVKKNITDEMALIRVQVDPKTLQWPPLQPGKTSEVQRILVRSSAQCTLVVRVCDPQNRISLIDPTSPIVIKNTRGSTISLQIKASETTSGSFHVPLRLFWRPTAGAARLDSTEIDATLSIIALPSWIKALRMMGWVVLLLTLACLLVSAIIYLKTGRSPMRILSDLRTRNFLEGELEPTDGTAANQVIVDLGMLKTKSTSFRSAFPSVDFGDSDALLTAESGRSGKRIFIRAVHGNVYVNKIETAEAELYDSDSVDIGTQSFRFAWLGHDRPIAYAEY